MLTQHQSNLVHNLHYVREFWVSSSAVQPSISRRRVSTPCFVMVGSNFCTDLLSESQIEREVLDERSFVAHEYDESCKS